MSAKRTTFRTNAADQPMGVPSPCTTARLHTRLPGVAPFHIASKTIGYITETPNHAISVRPMPASPSIEKSAGSDIITMVRRPKSISHARARASGPASLRVISTPSGSETGRSVSITGCRGPSVVLDVDVAIAGVDGRPQHRPIDEEPQAERNRRDDREPQAHHAVHQERNEVAQRPGEARLHRRHGLHVVED